MYYLEAKKVYKIPCIIAIWLRHAHVCIYGSGDEK